MAWVSTGTVSVTNGSSTVTGTGTSWFGGLQNGWGFVGPDGRVYEILTVDDATALTLKTTYQGATAAGQIYAAFPTGSLSVDLAASVQALIANHQGMFDTVGQGRFPGDVVFDADRDTGMGNPSSNEVALKAGGDWQLRLTDGQASGAAVQANATDASDGKLLKVGAGGILDTNPPNLANPAQLDVPAGLYSIAASDGWPFDGALLQLRRNAGRGVQIAARGSSSAPNASSEILVRTSGNSFGGWARLIHTENLLGTVSESGGTPTGAVVERGSNANGEYVRFADGTQICISPDFASVDVTTATGAIYRNASPLAWTFPATFSGGAGSVTGAVTSMGNSQTHWGSFRVLGFADADITVFAPSAATNRTVRAMAVGRWF
ncbi:hypothetical protein [Epibacterium sp. Ofav1-8]|uniref:hypothetical protein n=1 Tax=Epibacterium sp. Ofav1-8 TaxID=2917735 RepID=UPI001EF5442F|nr:hypothetical protein [Epibacterium sp. Ofav1-8]MCG7626061.1 hypothetical protein [Epibacterium sp. Ofav1-8]